MIRRLIKWTLRLALLALVLIVIFLLSLNSILRVVIEHNMSAQTGMDVEIGRFKMGWTKPTVEIQDLKIYNPSNFGGTPFLDIPEIHIEYDRTALLKKDFHLTLLRINLAELDIVKSADGKLNIYEFGKTPAKSSQKKSTAVAPDFKKQTGYDFKGIDALNVTFDKAKYIDLQNRHNDREQTIGIENWVVPKVQSPNDLAGLVVFIDLRSNHFFDPFVIKHQDSASLQSILNLIGVMF
jgi:uncharacterized protein involved in outer membrane biogenesis